MSNVIYLKSYREPKEPDWQTLDSLLEQARNYLLPLDHTGEAVFATHCAKHLINSTLEMLDVESSPEELAEEVSGSVTWLFGYLEISDSHALHALVAKWHNHLHGNGASSIPARTG